MKSADLDTVKSILETKSSGWGCRKLNGIKVSAAYLEKYIAMTNLFLI